MNNTPTGEIRPESTTIAKSIVDSIGTLAGPDDHVSMPRFRLERLLAEAAERGAFEAADDATAPGRRHIP